MGRRPGPKGTISTRALLEAVESLGPRWVAAFADKEVTIVNEAVDREQLAGRLHGHKLTEVGRKELQRLREADHRD